MYTINVTVEGIGRGLLMHKFSNEAAAQLSSVIKKVSKKRGSEEEEAEKAAYRLENGNLYLQLSISLAQSLKLEQHCKFKEKEKALTKKFLKANLMSLPIVSLCTIPMIIQ